MRVRIHVLNHHFWPDGSPSAVLVEELADSLREMGHDTVLVAGSGSFHEVQRPAPASPVFRLTSGESGKRHSQVAILRDYWLFWKAATTYIRDNVRDGDGILATSSPFLNVFLVRLLRRSGKRTFTMFNLQDYLPSNLRSLSVLHRLAAPFLKLVTDHYLRQWDLVLPCAGNIAYSGPNRVVARFWPTITKPAGRTVDTTSKTALYAGNLGIAHDTDALAEEVERLHDDGFQIDFYCDGPGLDKMPSYVRRHPFASGSDYVDVLYSHPVHLVCGVRRDGTGAFPSKTMNSLYIGAEVRPCGFQPEMMAELEHLRTQTDLSENRTYAARLVDAILRSPRARHPGTPRRATR